MFEEFAADALPLGVGQNGDIGYAADLALVVDASGDITDDCAGFFPDEDTLRSFVSDIVINMAQLSKLPITFANLAEALFYIAVNRYAVESNGGDALERGYVVGFIKPYHGC